MKMHRLKVIFPFAHALCAYFLSMFLGQLAQANAAELINVLHTPSGIRFGVLGTKGSSPAPTLFVFATNIEDSLASPTYNKVGTIVGQHGYLCVSLDLPYHPNEGLAGWAAATKQGVAWNSEFVSKVSQVLDYLIEQGYTDPQNVAVAGTSRGGFIAMHVAAADSRIKCVIGFIPVTDLTELTEFAGLKENQLAQSLSVMNIADKLAGRPVWVGIGNNDERVNTDMAIQFTRKVVAASVAKTKPNETEFIDVELHVMPWPGHGGGKQLCWGDLDAHDAAAEWLLTRMEDGAAEKGTGK